MYWYWMVFISLLFFAFLEQFSNLGRKNAKRICKIYTLFFIFISTIRWNQFLGDWKGYYSVFSQNSITSLEQVFIVKYWAFEPLYYLALRFIKYLTGNYTVLLFFMASVASIAFYYATVYFNEINIDAGHPCNRERSTIIATYFAFWATSCANIFTVRANMATAICLISIKYIEQKKTLNFVVIILIASMFHFAAIIFLLVYPFYYKRFNIKLISKIIFIAFVVSIIGIENIIPLAGVLGGRYAEKINSSLYVIKTNADVTYLDYSTTFVTIRAMVNTLLILAICFYIRNFQNLKKDKRFNGLFNIYVIGAFIQILTIRYNLQLARLSVFFLFFQFFLLPYVFKIEKNSVIKIVCFMAYTALMAVKMYSLLHSSPWYAEFTTVFDK